VPDHVSVPVIMPSEVSLTAAETREAGKTREEMSVHRKSEAVEIDLTLRHLAMYLGKCWLI